MAEYGPDLNPHWQALCTKLGFRDDAMRTLNRAIEQLVIDDQLQKEKAGNRR